MDELTEIARKYPTDKVDNGYTPFYDSVFSPHRSEFEKVCEIGVKYGGSISMWSDYFYNSTVYAIDAIEEWYNHIPKIDRVVGFFGNTRIRDDIKKFQQTCGSDFDMILDDGCHQTSAQQIAFGSFFPLVKSGGYYVIEDVSCCLDPHYGEEDRSDAVLIALIELSQTGKLGSCSSHMENHEREYIESNFDDIIFYSQCGDNFQRGVAATAVIRKK